MDDDEVFEESMASLGVEPLDGEESRTRRRRRPESDEATRRLFEQAMHDLETADADLSDPVPPRQIGPPKVRRLKGRRLAAPIDEQIDLHGLMATEALERLERFVADASAAGARAVLAITGKGHHSPGGRGVLKRRVEAWIRGPGRRWVRAYSEAPRALGGGGAYILSLRKSP